jgi:hypothetical protein
MSALTPKQAAEYKVDYLRRMGNPPGWRLDRLEYLDALDQALARARNIRSLPTEIKRKGETFSEMRKRLGLRVVK